MPVATLVSIVDDDESLRQSLPSLVEKFGFRVRTFKSAEEFLASDCLGQTACLILDIAMPGMSGLDVAVHLKELERSRDIPIIFVTAFGNDPAEIHRAYSAGGADYLVKPLDAEIVRKKVAVFVDLSRRQRRNADSRTGTRS